MDNTFSLQVVFQRSCSSFLRRIQHDYSPYKHSLGKVSKNNTLNIWKWSNLPRIWPPATSLLAKWRFTTRAKTSRKQLKICNSGYFCFEWFFLYLCSMHQTWIFSEWPQDWCLERNILTNKLYEFFQHLVLHDVEEDVEKIS